MKVQAATKSWWLAAFTSLPGTALCRTSPMCGYKISPPQWQEEGA